MMKGEGSSGEAAMLRRIKAGRVIAGCGDYTNVCARVRFILLAGK